MPLPASTWSAWAWYSLMMAFTLTPASSGDCPDAVENLLCAYDWPGNVRQLINAIERGKILGDDGIIRLHDLPREVTQPESAPAISGELLSDDLAALQRSKVVSVLRRVHGNKSHAAKMLGIERRKLYRLLDKYQISDAETTAGRPAGSESESSTNV